MLRSLAQLLRKYDALIALRARREELEATGRAGFSTAEGALRRGAFRVVAREFPGALRELERTCLEALERKRTAIRVEHEAVQAGQPISRRWVAVMIDFHDTLRETLAAKMWLARRLGRDGAITDEILTEFNHWHDGYPAAPHGLCCASGSLTTEFLRAHHHPPGGRVLSLVWGALGRRHGGSAEELGELVFGEQC